MSDDVYQDLAPELIALLRDPRVVLPGELEAFDAAAKWIPAIDSEDVVEVNAGVARPYVTAEGAAVSSSTATAATA
jgi:hypothetical protein